MISRETGLSVTEIQSIQQSIEDIITTPIGTRIMRREYGSTFADLVDQPMNEVLIIRMYSAIYTPISRWEDRISIESLNISKVSSGSLQLDLEAVHMITGQPLNLNIPLSMGAST